MVMARGRPDLDERFNRSKLHRYLLADESVIVAQRRHWAVIALPTGAAILGLLVVVALNVRMKPSLLTDLLWWAWLILAVWAVLRWFLWRREWLVATDKRVMVNYGLLHQGVAMFSLSRVPDLTYTRSTLGQLLGYGELEREGTGDSLTLHNLRFVEHPHATYTTICAAIFNLQDRMFGMDEDENGHRFEDRQSPHTPGPHAPYVAPQDRKDPVEFLDASDEPNESGGIQITYGGSPQGEQETWYPSPELPDSALRDADTGPIPYRRSATDEGEGWRTTNNKGDRNRDSDRARGRGQDH